MSEARPPDDPALNESLHRDLELDRLCVEYESAWRAGQSPRVEDFLSRASDSLRPQLHEELLALDREMRGSLKAVVVRAMSEASNASTPKAATEPLATALDGDVEAARRATLSHTKDSFDWQVPHLPGYEILEELGRGGMGVVYKARQIGLNRIVALKMMLAGPHAAKEVLTRFLLEAQTVARLKHSHIVQIHEIGEHAGMPFLVLEFCERGCLTKKLAGAPQPVREAAQLVETLARAMHVAHQAGILHRDLKPANVLLAADGTPKITDFGLAKRLEEGPGLTHTGAVMGTPSYMAPEQANGSQAIGPAADVYALGAILYELVTGRPPFRGASTWDTIQQVISEDPVALRRLQSKTPVDLETVCLKCLRKQPRERYATAGDLAADLQRFQAGKPVLARPVGGVEWITKWARRHPLVASLMTAVVLVTAGGLGGITWALRMALAEKGIAHLKATDAEVAARRADKEAEAARLLAEQEKQAREKMQEAQKATRYQLRRVQDAHHAFRIKAAQAALLQNDAATAELILNEGDSLYTEAWETLFLHNFCRRRTRLMEGQAHDDGVSLSANGKRIACGVDNHCIRVWDADTGRNLITLQGHTGRVFKVCLSADGKRLASASWDETVKIWDTETGRDTLTIPVHTTRFNASISADGKRVAVAIRWDKVVKVWNAETGRDVATLRGHTDHVYGVCMSADGKRLASTSWDNTVRIWETEIGKEILTLRGQNGRAVSLSEDGKRGASASGETIGVWDAETGKSILRLSTDHAENICLSGDGKRIASGRGETVKIWDTESGRELITLRGHTRDTTDMQMSADGRRLVSAGADNTIRVWELHQVDSEKRILSGHPGGTLSVGLSEDGIRLASAGGDDTIKVWNANTGQELLTLRGHKGRVSHVSLSADGKRVASAGLEDDTVRVWDTNTGQEVNALHGHTDAINGVSLSPDGKRVASASKDNTVKVWDPETGKVLCTLRGHEGLVSSVWLSADSKRLASASYDNTAKVWDAESGVALATLRHSGPVLSVFLSEDGKRILSTDGDTVRIWDAEAGQEILTLRGHTAPVLSVCLSRDGKRVVSASYDKTVKVWDAETGQEMITLQGHRDMGVGVSMSGDGKRIVSGGTSISIWDAHSSR